MFPGVNPRQMQGMMKKMGVSQVDIPATEVIIKTADKEIIIVNPQVAKVKMMGQETFQISGEIHEREVSTEPEINEDDIQTVIDQTGVQKEDAMNALKAAKGDLAQAIIDIQEQSDE